MIRSDPNQRHSVEDALLKAERDYELVLNEIRNREAGIDDLRARAGFSGLLLFNTGAS